MSFLKALFGGGGSKPGAGDPAGGKVVGQDSYKDFVIKATPMSAGGEHQICGVIEKEIGGEQKSYRFVRADKMSSLDDCAAMTLAKGRQIIDEQGDGVFR